MKEFFRNKFSIIVVIISTLVLAGIAIFTAVRLFQLRKESVSPAKPESAPQAQIEDYISCDALLFNITGGTPIPTPTGTGINTPTPTPTRTPGDGEPTPTPTPTGTDDATPTPTPTGTSATTPTPTTSGGTTLTSPGSSSQAQASSEPTLPESGISWPTIVGLGGASLILLISLILAL